MGVLDFLTPVLNPIIERVFPNPKDRYDFQVRMAQLADQENQRAHDEMMGQINTNTAEANRGNMFVAGWRPAVGWVGAVGLGYSFVVEPFSSWIAKVMFHYSGSFPILDTGQLMALVTGMLGFGGMRVVEKLKGVPDSTPLGGVATPQPVAPKKKVLGIEWPF